MKITAIKQQHKNPDRVSIFIDNRYSFSLSYSQLLGKKLKKGLELEEQEVKALKKISEEGKFRSRVLSWSFRRPHSEKELHDYLYKKKIEPDFAKSIVSEFRQKGYVDDKKFSFWFAENRIRKGRSVRAVEAELKNKGVQYKTIKNVVSYLQTEYTEQENISKQVSKMRKKARYKDDQALLRYLLNKGFSYSDIKATLKKDSFDD